MVERGGWARWYGLRGLRNKLRSAHWFGQRGCVIEAEFLFDAIHTAGEIAEELPDGFEIAVRRIHGLLEALSANRCALHTIFKESGYLGSTSIFHRFSQIFHLAGALSLGGSPSLPRTMVSEAAGRVYVVFSFATIVEVTGGPSGSA